MTNAVPQASSNAGAGGQRPVLILCPRCRRPLTPAGDDFALCEQGHTYPLVLGRIVDLMPGETDRTIPNYAELVATLTERFQSASASELNGVFLSHLRPVTDKLGKNRFSYTESALERNARMSAAFRDVARRHFDMRGADAALEVGCGHGGTLAMLAPLYGRVVGIDVSLPRLILAAKLLDEQQAHNVQLVRTMAQHLPFAKDAFDYVTAINVMEHVMEPEPVLAAVWDCMQPGALFVADSRNRYDLFFPEPHVKLRWVGFLPRRWVKRYIGWRTGHPYENIRLLSYRDWLRLLRSDRWEAQIVSAPAEAYGYAPALGRIVDRLVRLPLAGRVVIATAPSHLIVAQKVGAG